MGKHVYVRLLLVGGLGWAVAGSRFKACKPGKHEAGMRIQGDVGLDAAQRL